MTESLIIFGLPLICFAANYVRLLRFHDLRRKGVGPPGERGCAIWRGDA
jgi:hypothetical protein